MTFFPLSEQETALCNLPWTENAPKVALPQIR